MEFILKKEKKKTSLESESERERALEQTFFIYYSFILIIPVISVTSFNIL